MGSNEAKCADEPTVLRAAGRCGAKNPDRPGKVRKHDYCHNFAGQRTAHKGQGRCWLHGGHKKPVVDEETGLMVETDRRLSGLYAGIHSPRIMDLLAKVDDTDPRDLLGELKLLRVLVVDFINRHEESTEALLAWHASFTDLWVGGNTATWVAKAKTKKEFEARMEVFRNKLRSMEASKPRKVLDLISVAVLIDKITKVVLAMEKMRNDGVVTLMAYKQVMTEMGTVLVTEVQDQKIIKAINKGFGRIRVRDRW